MADRARGRAIPRSAVLFSGPVRYGTAGRAGPGGELAGASGPGAVISAIFRVIGAASALSTRARVYGEEKVYGSIP